MRLAGPALGLIGAGLLACAPPALVSVERAMDICTDKARAARQPSGTVAVAVGAGGPAMGVSISLTDDYLRGRDPTQVYNECVQARSGQAPTRPLVL